ncbi:MAG: CBS domain-containing protein [Rhizobiales bacterium]|nr:CBS domain-containing protein [Hyphomicrobiales bacterium]NRB13766.1 CBS domain-containing protein [Hyphomicrobiales bacterium]
MTVSTLIKGKSHEIMTISQNDSLRDVCKILADKRIGVLIVCSSAGHVEGIISERDIVRSIGTSGPHILDEFVKQHMTKDPVTCSPIESIDNVMSKMSQGRFRHMPVLEDKKLVAIISIGDIVKARIEAMEQEARAMHEYIGT